MADHEPDLHPDSQEAADIAAVKDALKFFDWAYANGDKMAEELDYVPLPDSVVALVKKSWADIVGPGN